MCISTLLFRWINEIGTIVLLCSSTQACYLDHQNCNVFLHYCLYVHLSLLVVRGSCDVNGHHSTWIHVMFNTGTSKSRRPAFQVTSRQSKVLAISLVFVLLCCLLFYVSEYRVKWSGKKKIRTREHFFYAGRTVTEANCKAIINGDEFELKKADLLHNVSRNILQPEDYIKMTQNCPQFVLEREYITDYLTDLERDFPIAFSLLMFKDVEQAERLLRAIYRPQNFYCIHVDAKSDESIYSAMQGVASCFENMHVLATRVDVQWGFFSVLEPELLCMEHLWNRSAAWRYFVNLTGQEFPLRTNYELVRILQAYKGANDVEGTVKRYSPFVL